MAETLLGRGQGIAPGAARSGTVIGPGFSAPVGAPVPGRGSDLFGESAGSASSEGAAGSAAAVRAATPVIAFFVPGEPKGKGRLRTRIVQPKTGKAFVHGYTPSKTVEYENMVRLAAEQVMQGREPIAGPVRVTVEAIFPLSESASKPKRQRMLAGLEYPRRYDLDNVVKAIFDGMNRIVWNDDKQVVRCFAEKRYGERTGVHVCVEAA